MTDSRARRTRPTSRRLAAAAALLALAGCGTDDRATAPPPPRLPRALAQDFAHRADAIARKLDTADQCGALREATALQRQSIALIGRVPPAYQETLQGTINDLVSKIRCVPAISTQPEPQKPEEEHGKGHGEGKHKHGGGDD